MKLFSLMAGLLMCTFTGLYAQADTEIRGTVLDENGAGAEFVNVLLLQASDSSLVKGAITEIGGTYLIEGIDNGVYVLAATMVGYDAIYSETFELSPERKNFRPSDLVFEAAGVALDEIVVKAQKPFIELSQNKIIVNVESSPVAAGNSALEVLERAPGILVDQNDTISLKGRQGVLILIDGKETYLSNQEIAQMLESMSADDIESIEIISNPSSRHEAAGNSGVINIKLKKDKSLGTNGSLSGGFGYWERPWANTSVHLNHRQKKYNLFGGYSYYCNLNFQELNISRKIPFEEGAVAQFDQTFLDEKKWSSHRVNLGADWFLNDQTAIGVLSNIRFGDFSSDRTNETEISGDNPEPYTPLSSSIDQDETWVNQTHNLNLKHEFAAKGRSLTFDADYSSFNSPEDTDFTNLFFDQEGIPETDPLLLRSDIVSEITIYDLKADYTHPLGEKMKLGSGLEKQFCGGG